MLFSTCYLTPFTRELMVSKCTCNNLDRVQFSLQDLAGLSAWAQSQQIRSLENLSCVLRCSQMVLKGGRALRIRVLTTYACSRLVSTYFSHLKSQMTIPEIWNIKMLLSSGKEKKSSARSILISWPVCTCMFLTRSELKQECTKKKSLKPYPNKCQKYIFSHCKVLGPKDDDVEVKTV